MFRFGAGGGLPTIVFHPEAFGGFGDDALSSGMRCAALSSGMRCAIKPPAASIG